MKVPQRVVFDICLTVHQRKGDLPHFGEQVLNEDGDKIIYRGNSHWTKYSDYYEKEVETRPPRLWYDIPRFEFELKKEDLEAMSKEQLIEMITTGVRNEIISEN